MILQWLRFKEERGEEMSKEKLAAISKAVASGKAEAQKFTQEALAEKVSAEQIVREALCPAMKKVGEGMQEEEYAFPEIQSAVKSLQSVLDILRPSFKGTTSASAIPKWIGKGEVYELGGHLVTFVDKGAGLPADNLIPFFDECIRGLLEQVDIPCHKQSESTQKA
jgi:methanogenic corrinoid protein MtbC1